MILFYLLSGKACSFDTATDDDIEAKIRLGQSDLSSVTDRVTVDKVQRMLGNKPSADKLLKHSHLCSYR